MDSQWSKEEACFARATQVLANEFDVRSELHGQWGLADVNQIYVIPEAMSGCKNLKIH